MGDHIAVDCTEQLLTNPTPESSTTQMHIAIPFVEEISAAMEAAKAKSIAVASNTSKPDKHEDDADKAECRVCQDEDFVTKMEVPCHCSGTMKFAHRSCIERWCNAKGNSICEICFQPYHPNNAVTEPTSADTAIDISESWRIPGTDTQIQSPLLVPSTATDRFTAALNDDCSCMNHSGVLCGTGLLLFLGFYLLLFPIEIGAFIYSKNSTISFQNLPMFLALFTLRDAFYSTPSEEDKSLSHKLFCAMVIVAPVYILAWIYECRFLRDSERGRSAITHVAWRSY